MSGRARASALGLLALLVPALPARSQQPAAPDELAAPAAARGTHFRYGLALGYDQARDDLLLPMAWAGLGVGLRTAMERVGARTRHTFSLQLPASLLQNRFGHKALALGAEASYTVDRAVGRAAGGVLALGGQVKWDLHDGFYASWDEEHAYWLTAYSLGPRVAWRRVPGSGSGLSAELDLPLIAAVARPPATRLLKTDPLTHVAFHLFDTSRNPVLTGFPRYTAAHLGLAWTRPWGGGRLVLSYDLELNTYSQPARVTTLSSRFGIARAGGR